MRRERRTYALQVEVVVDVPETLNESDGTDVAMALLHEALKTSTSPHAPPHGKPHLVDFDLDPGSCRPGKVEPAVPTQPAQPIDPGAHWLRAGDRLYSTCAADHFAEVLSVGHDDNGLPAVDLALRDPADIVITEGDDAKFPHAGLTRLEYVPPSPGGRFVMRDVLYVRAADSSWATGDEHPGRDGWALTGAMVDLLVPGDGCDKCVRWLYVERRLS